MQMTISQKQDCLDHWTGLRLRCSYRREECRPVGKLVWVKPKTIGRTLYHTPLLTVKVVLKDRLEVKAVIDIAVTTPIIG